MLCDTNEEGPAALKRERDSRDEDVLRLSTALRECRAELKLAEERAEEAPAEVTTGRDAAINALVCAAYRRWPELMAQGRDDGDHIVAAIQDVEAWSGTPEFIA